LFGDNVAGEFNAIETELKLLWIKRDPMLSAPIEYRTYTFDVFSERSVLNEDIVHYLSDLADTIKCQIASEIVRVARTYEPHGPTLVKETAKWSNECGQVATFFRKLHLPVPKVVKYRAPSVRSDTTSIGDHAV